jgi:glycine/D-amino acid oxidase-like deaminating enzyme
MTTADIVIIGGGPAGTATLWAIEQLEPGTHTILLEASGSLGAGSSTASLEAFRTCWPTHCIAQQMKRSIDIFLNADDHFGEGAAESLAVKQQGYLFCGFTEDQAAALHGDVDHLHRVGMGHIEFLDTQEVQYRYPWLGNRLLAGKFDPVAGWLDSNSLINLYVQNAPSAECRFNVHDISILAEGGKVVGVKCSDGDISTSCVVICAGAGSQMVARRAGLDLPITAIPRQSFTTGWRHRGFEAHAPMIIGSPSSPHVHPEAGSGAIFGWEYSWNSKHKTTGRATHVLKEPQLSASSYKDPRFPSITLALLARQFGHHNGDGFSSPQYLRGIHHNAGYYVYRDENAAYHIDEQGNRQPYESERAIIDRHPDVKGLFMSVAHVGHGIMTSPAAGEHMACLVLGRELPDPAYKDFGLDKNWVEFDNNAL